MEYKTETQLRQELAAVWALLDAGRAERDALRATLAAYDAEQSAKAVPAALRRSAERTRQDLGPTGSNYPDVRVLLAFVEQALASPTPPAPEAQQAAGQEQDERDAFEAWADSVFCSGLASVAETWNYKVGSYSDAAHQRAWQAWQAAMTRAREAVGSVPVPRTWDFATSRHSWVTSQDFDDYRAAVLRALGGK